MNIFELKRSDVKNLYVIPSDVSFKQRYFTVILFSDRKEIDSGYSPMTIVATKKYVNHVEGVLPFHPDSISLEKKKGVTWHVNCLPKSGGMQIWATGDNEIKSLHVWGADTLYIEAE